MAVINEYYCTNCNAQVKERDVFCKKCKKLLAVDGSVKISKIVTIEKQSQIDAERIPKKTNWLMIKSVLFFLSFSLVMFSNGCSVSLGYPYPIYISDEGWMGMTIIMTILPDIIFLIVAVYLTITYLPDLWRSRHFRWGCKSVIIYQFILLLIWPFSWISGFINNKFLGDIIFYFYLITYFPIISLSSITNGDFSLMLERVSYTITLLVLFLMGFLISKYVLKNKQRNH